MKKMAVLAAAALLALSTTANAGPKGGGAGASQFSPGDQMRDSGGPIKGSRGASEFSPGDRMRDSSGTTGRGASEFSPGDQMNDTRKKH
jgi:hypothetical protein